MFTIKTSLTQTATSSDVIAVMNRQYWPMMAAIAPWILRYGWTLADNRVHLVFDNACIATICALAFRGLPVRATCLGDIFTPFLLTGDLLWTREELVKALEQRSRALVRIVHLEADGEKWRVWVQGSVTLKDMRAHLKGVGNGRSLTLSLVADRALKAHTRFYGNPELHVVGKATTAGPPPLFGNGLNLGAEAQITCFDKAELEAEDEQRKRTELPVDSKSLYRPSPYGSLIPSSYSSSSPPSRARAHPVGFGGGGAKTRTVRASVVVSPAESILSAFHSRRPLYLDSLNFLVCSIISLVLRLV
jgi:hypothetical protein